MGRSRDLSFLSAALGWSYFVAWSVSFVPQIVLNWRRRSVEGMSFEYQLLNLLGFSSYAIYCCALTSNEDVKRHYKDAFGAANLVTVQDACFALWAAAMTAAILAQIFAYAKTTTPATGTGRRDSSRRCFHPFRYFHPKVLGVVLGVTALTVLYAVAIIAGPPTGRLAVSGVPLWSWLAWLYWLSAVKLGVTLSKYFPQAYLNYRRKSTVGWSIANVLLDFTGGTLSIAQLLLDGATIGWTGVVGDPIKFALGFVSTVFDSLFILQHYVLYPSRRGATTQRRGKGPPPLGGGSPLLLGEEVEEEEGSSTVIIGDYAPPSADALFPAAASRAGQDDR